MTDAELRVGLGLLSVYPSSNAGTTTYVRGVLRGLADDPSVRITAIANTEMAAACEDLTGPRFVVRDSRRFTRLERRMGRVAALSIASSSSIAANVWGEEIDVVHYPQSVRAPRLRRPTVVTLHDVLHRDHPELFSAPVRAWRRLMYDESARRADVVITDSEHAASRIEHHLGIDRSRIVVSHLGVDHQLFTPATAASDQQTLRALGIAAPFLYYPASLAPHKNHATLLRALQMLDGRHLVLTGPHSGRLAELEAEAQARGVRDRVHHLGMVDTAVLPVLYRNAECLVFPSLYEGFGVPIVEAMACGCAIACSNRGAPAEIAGGAAYPFDPESPEAIAHAVRSLDDPELRSRLATLGVTRAEHFTWQEAARHHLLAYRSALAGAAGADDPAQT